ncbi:hypothetical protein VPH526E571_0017 [Vibrio phage 526E57-1]
MNDLGQYKALRTALLMVRKEIRTGCFSDYGLCSRVECKLKDNLDGDYYLIREITQKFERLMLQWPEYSGSIDYPIGQNSEGGYYLIRCDNGKVHTKSHERFTVVRGYP